jgi:hypothetical protein
MSFTSMQKLNYKCSSCIYIMNYRLCKLYYFIIHLPFYTFQRWWWMWQQPYNQQLNIQHAFMFFSSQLLFYFIFLNNSTSSSCFCLCSLLCTSLSFTIHYNFSIKLSIIMLLWILEPWKCSQLPTTNENHFERLPFFLSWNFLLLIFIYLLAHCLLINAWSSKLIWPITTSLCVLYTTMWKCFPSSLWMNAIDFIFQLFHIPNLLTLVVLTPPHLPYTPFIDCAHLSANCVNSFIDCDDTFINCIVQPLNYASKFNGCTNTPND